MARGALDDKDLRNCEVWREWVGTRPYSLLRVLLQAGFQYFSFTDTVSLVFPAAAGATLTEGFGEELADVVGQFYEVSQREWLSTMTQGCAEVSPAPSVAISPHIQIEVAPPYVHLN